MELYLTRHARNRMRLYAIPIEQVQRALTDPDHVIPGSFERRNAWKQLAQDRWLRITFRDEGSRRVVITVTPKGEPPGGHDAH